MRFVSSVAEGADGVLLAASRGDQPKIGIDGLRRGGVTVHFVNRMHAKVFGRGPGVH
jgi:hypothetical protein